MKKAINGTIAVAFSIILLTTNLYGCGKAADNIPVQPTPEIDTDKVVSEVVADIMEDIEQPDTTEEIVAEASTTLYSSDWQDYIGDFETFVYGLITNDLKYAYDVFPAYVELSSGDCVSGIGYTNYEEGYASDDESICYFSAGLIPYYGELSIPEEDFEDGLILYNLDYKDDKAGFLLQYQSDEFTDHCIVYDKYLKYGVNKEGKLYYETEDYSEDKIDKSAGSLYSYDEAKYIYETDFGRSFAVSGISLSAQMDFDELQEEVNKVLESQDFNLVSVDVTSCAYFAQEAVSSYLLSLQQETFLGYDVKTLIELAEQLDPTECYRITSDGLMVVDFNVNDPNTADSMTKWLVGSTCVVIMAVAGVGSYITAECPPLSALNGMIAGVAVDVFMQVVVESKSLDNVNWGKVALSAATGAVSAYIGPYAAAKYEGVAHFIIDSAIDGFLGGAEYAVEAWIEGGDADIIIQQMGYGFALAFGMSAGFKVAGKMLEKAIAAVGPEIAKVSDKMLPHLDIKESRLGKILDNISGRIATLRKKADMSIFRSEYIANKNAIRAVENFMSDNPELLEDSLKSLTTKEIIDLENNVIDKKELAEIFKKASDGDIIAKIQIEDEFVDVVKKNGVIGIYFDPNKYITVKVPGGLTDDRDVNFVNAAEELKKSFIENPERVPKDLYDIISPEGESLEKVLDSMNDKRLVEIIQGSEWVIHENTNLLDVTLVPKDLHSVSGDFDGIAHFGGVGLANRIKQRVGDENFQRYLEYLTKGNVTY